MDPLLAFQVEAARRASQILASQVQVPPPKQAQEDDANEQLREPLWEYDLGGRKGSF